MNPRIALPIASLLLPACGGLHLESDEGGVVEPEVVIDESDPCEELPSTAVSDGAVDGDLAWGLACGHPVRLTLSAVADGYADGDSLAAAAWFVGCAEDEGCQGERAAELGLASFLAGQLDNARTAVELPEEHQAALDARIDAALTELAARVDAMSSARQEVYVDTPGIVARELAAARDRYADNYEIFETTAPIAEEELDAGEPSSSTRTELNSIRNTTVAACLESSGLLLQECLDGPVARAATSLLLRIAVAQEDWGRARVELGYLESGTDRSSFFAVVVAREADAVDRMNARFEQAEAARADGDSDEEVAAQFGEPMNLSGDTALPWSPGPLPVSRNQVTDQVRQVCGTVEGIEEDGDGVVIEFERIRISPREFDCVEGPHREVRWGAREIVLEDCAEFEDSIRLQPDDIRISLSDASNLEEGNVIEGWITQDRSGSIAAVYKDDDASVATYVGAFANP